VDSKALAEPEAVAGASTTGASVLRGGAWNVASRAIPQVYLVVVSIAAARFLGPDRLGRQSFIAFSSITVATLFTAGLPSALTRFVGDAMGRGRPAEARGLLDWGWRAEALGAAAAGGLLAAAVVAGAEPRAAWALAAVIAAAGVLVKVPNSFLIGVQRWRGATVAGLATGTVGTAATVVVLAAGGGITGMFAVEACVALATLALLGRVARQASLALPAPPEAPPQLRRAVVRYAAVSSISIVITLVIWRRSELFFLEHFSSDTEIAFYSIAFAAVTAPVVIFQAMTSVLFPAVATLFGAGAEERIRSGYSRASRLLVMASFPLTSFGIALGPALLRLAYGRGFGSAGPVFLILVSILPLIPLVNLAGVTLSAIGRLWPPIFVGIVASIVDVVLDIVLIPQHGAVGAAVANVAAQATAAIGIVAYAERALGGTQWKKGALARAATAAAGAGLVAWAAVQWLGDVTGLVAGLGAGVLTLVLLGRALRILPAADAAWLEDIAGRLAGGRVGRLIRLWAEPVAEARAS